MHLIAKSNIICKNKTMREVLFFQVKYCNLEKKKNNNFLPALFAIPAKGNFEMAYCFKSVKS